MGLTDASFQQLVVSLFRKLGVTSRPELTSTHVRPWGKLRIEGELLAIHPVHEDLEVYFVANRVTPGERFSEDDARLMGHAVRGLSRASRGSRCPIAPSPGFNRWRPERHACSAPNR